MESPRHHGEQILISSKDLAAAGEMDYVAFPDIVQLSSERVLISFKQGSGHARDHGASLKSILLNPITCETSPRQTLGHDPELIYQMGEWVEFPDGSLASFVDLQRVTDDRGKPRNHRTGLVWCRSSDAGQALTPMKQLGPIDGVEYGYVFDSVIVGRQVYMLAMSFPELNGHASAFDEDGQRIFGEVSVLRSEDNGQTWRHLRNLSQEFGKININESALIAEDDGFVIATRGYDNQARLHRVDCDFNLLMERNLTTDAPLIESHIGRPRLLEQEGHLYLLGRNWRSGQMELILLRLDRQTLGIQRIVKLDPCRGEAIADGYYALPYFQPSSEGLLFNVITYRRHAGQTGSDLVRLEYRWDEVR